MTFDEAVSSLGRVARMTHGGSLKAIRQALGADEEVVALSSANRKDKKEPGVLAITSQRVIWASKTVGTGGTVDFRYDRIATVESGKDLMSGHNLKLSTSGVDLTLGSLAADYGNEIRSRM
jgi:PH (Pleckstrin Homology) domain-containing protein